MPKSGPLRRPREWSQDLADELLGAFVAQNRGLTEFCNRNRQYPSSATVWEWMAEREDFKVAVDLARERQLERMMYSTLAELIDCDPTDRPPGEGPALVAKLKAAAEMSQKLATKMVPRRYCERLAVDLDGKVTGKITLTIAAEDAEEVDESQVIGD